MHNNMEKTQFYVFTLNVLFNLPIYTFHEWFWQENVCNDRWFQCNTSLRWWNIMKYANLEGGGWRGFVKLTLLVILCAERSIKKLPFMNIFSSVYAILNVSMSHTLICFYGYMLFVRLTTCVLGLKKDNSFNLVL